MFYANWDSGLSLGVWYVAGLKMYAQALKKKSKQIGAFVLNLNHLGTQTSQRAECHCPLSPWAWVWPILHPRTTLQREVPSWFHLLRWPFVSLFLAFETPPRWHLRSLCVHLNLSHPVHASSHHRGSYFNQKDPFGTYVCGLIYASRSHLRKIFSFILSLVGDFGYSGKIFRHVRLDILYKWVCCGLLCQG